ncbi:protein fam89b-like [Plakobranchus ocellatus]|uniref:Protein fam89b-like n=1 Tax=Plakobranchus ocellatus TaxID=259542 RepID=A0AAV4ATC4_9GAST|nr:protein fam89b-like [Plakobranchus ocellatus]
MQNLFLGDYPPIPECFSHLIDQNSEVKSDDIYCNQMKRHMQHEDDKAGDKSNNIVMNSRNNVSECAAESETLHEENLDETTLGGTFQKLNSSLGKLQREMKDLRSLDISLFYQLLALNEAIQDFKLNASDRFSESGSEYSLGTASYMGSMTSLNEDSDWAEEATVLNSPQFEGNNTLLAEEDQNSTKELLMQITDLAMRADQDF